MKLPVDVVIIGLNSARTLGDCLDSVRRSTYPGESITVYYVDGGSTDGSVEIAQDRGARVVPYQAETPAPGGQRNAGWRMGSGTAVQFLDSDTILDPDWLAQGVNSLKAGVGAVNGNRKERFPEASWMNWIGDQEWNGPAGEAREFGGDVLILREALEKTGGYDDRLIGGEDPELSYRIRQAGYTLQKLDQPMTRHDLGMKTLRQYWKRAFRSGHAYAEVNHRHPDFWATEVRRIQVRGTVFVVGWLAVVGLVWSWPFVAGPLLGTGFLCLPRVRSVRYFETKGMTRKQARLYAWHASLVIIPQFCGLVRFGWGRLTNRPLTNRKLRKAKA